MSIIVKPRFTYIGVVFSGSYSMVNIQKMYIQMCVGFNCYVQAVCRI